MTCRPEVLNLPIKGHRMANERQYSILRQGVDAWNDWRGAHPEARIGLEMVDLHKAKVAGVDFSGARLGGAILDYADLTGANLNDADLTRANLRSARLSRTLLCGAALIGADLQNANIKAADLTTADLTGANLTGANLANANFTQVLLRSTSLVGIDLSTIIGLDTARHEGPSYVSIDTIYRSRGNIPQIFLRGCGVPENFIVYMPSLTGRAFEFYSCFISHSAEDKRFCERLYADLQAKGVRVWYFPEDATWGETVWGEIDRSIKIYDKLVVVCSENSLQSVPVQREIERALNREDKEHKNILFPITLDRYVFDKWEHSRQADVLAKVVGDFTGWEHDALKYEKAFERLLKGLQSASTAR